MIKSNMVTERFNEFMSALRIGYMKVECSCAFLRSYCEGLVEPDVLSMQRSVSLNEINYENDIKKKEKKEN